MSAAELVKNHSHQALLDMCAEKGVRCMKSWTKTQLAAALAPAIKKSPKPVAKARSPVARVSPVKSPKKSSSKGNAPALKAGLACNTDQKTCESSRKYVKDDIIALAKQCGVSTEGTRA